MSSIVVAWDDPETGSGSSMGKMGHFVKALGVAHGWAATLDKSAGWWHNRPCFDAPFSPSDSA
jgi:hypothetical protein